MRALPLILLILIGTSEACVFEIRSAVFYPNGTQEIGRDWLIVDFENNYSYDLFDVEFGDIAYVSVIKSGEKVRIDPYKNLAPTNFPLIINTSLRTLDDRSEVVYSITNIGNTTEVEIAIPIFSGFISCENCEISNGSIIFRKTLSRNETASFRLISSRSFSVPDAKIGFKYEETFSLNFTANVPISVVKGRSDKWIGIFNLTNTIDREIHVNATALADFQNGSRIELFSENFVLNKGETFSRSEEIQSSEVPVFIFKVNARVFDFCRLTIIPAYELDGRYIIGQAVLKGFSHTPPILPGRGGLPGGGLPIVTPAVPTPVPTPETTPTPRVERVSPELRIAFERIPIEYAIPYFVAVFPSLFGLFIVTVLPIRRGVVVTGEHEKVARILSPRFRIYCPPSSPVKFGIVVEPDRELYLALLDNGISRENAEAIAVAIKVKKPLITNREEVARMALKLGIPVMMYGRAR